MPQKGDILVDNHYLFEVGGKNKNHKQIANIPNSYVIADNIDVGFENKIPLWLFGFLYWYKIFYKLPARFGSTIGDLWDFGGLSMSI